MIQTLRAGLAALIFLTLGVARPRVATADLWQPLGLKGREVKGLALEPTHAATIYAILGESAGVYRSDDAGITWTSKSVVLGALAALVVSEVPGTVYVGTFSNGVFRTMDRGETWTQNNAGLTSLNIRSLVSAPVAGVIIAGTASGVFKAASNGGSWVFAGPPGIVANGVYHLAASPDARVLFASTSSQILYRSLDGGATWSVLAAPSGFLTDLKLDASTEILYATAADGIYRSVDAGATWSRLFQAPNGVSFMVVAMDPSNRMVLYAGAGPFQRIFRSTDAGASWSLFDTGLPNVFVPTIVVSPDGQRVYAGTSNGLIGGAGVYIYAPAGICVPDPSHLCLLGGRFRASLTALDPRTGNTGAGQTIPQSDRYGMFSLPSFTGDPGFPEVIVKMADVTGVPPPLGGSFWLFHTGLTDLQYTLTVVDLVTGATRTYQNDRSDPSRHCGAADTAAFKN